MRKWKIAAILLVVLGSAAGASYWYLHSRFHLLEWHEVTLSDFEARGQILDIGGGGEGIIGRLKGEQVLAIDISQEELDNAPPGPIKMVMDARDLRFQDGRFNTATAFFTLMYIRGEDQEKVFREVFRVLTPGGRFLIWDARLPKRAGEAGDTIMIPLTIRLPKEQVRTGYGTGWPEETQDLAYYSALARKAGFRIEDAREQNQIFTLQLGKP